MITIFLDLDGVISILENSLSDRDEFWKNDPKAKLLGIPHSLDENSIKVLNEILSIFECEIVISSDWKKTRTLENLDKIFKHCKIIQSPINKTKNLRNDFNIDDCRAMEIMHFIAENMVENFIILDDLDLENKLSPRILDRFFKTEFELGLAKPGLKEQIIERMKLFK